MNDPDRLDLGIARMYHLFLVLVVATAAAGCASSSETAAMPEGATTATDQATEPEQAPPRYDVVPRPQHLAARDGAFALNDSTRIVLSDPGNEQLRSTAQLFAQVIRTGVALPMRVAERPAEGRTPNAIALLLTGDGDTAEEDTTAGSYSLDVTPRSIVVRAKTSKGLFYGLQTIRQLLPPAVERAIGLNDRTWTVPAVHIEDAPRFPYRGMHLDVGRHFFPPSFIKRYIDLLALYKLDTFHWHLTEDQGWRIEIKKYPRLTEVGACRDSSTVGVPRRYDGAQYCGYYTQDDVREIVDYAQRRHITIIPEIEMPGHSSAAVASYPEFGCTGKPIDVATTWGIYEDIYCPSEKTFRFLEDVLTEVMQLFPSKYIHIGGDEAPKAQWENSEVAQQVMEREGLEDEEELQTYFVDRIGKFLRENGRELIGWEDIMQGGIPRGATVMAWRSPKTGIKAARQDHDVVMAVNDAFYFNFCHDPAPQEPACYEKKFYPTLQDVYTFDVVPDALTKAQADHILGGQANVWTENILTPNKVEYTAFPYMLALAENVWTAPARQDWSSFKRRMRGQVKRLKELEVNYHPLNFMDTKDRP